MTWKTWNHAIRDIQHAILAEQSWQQMAALELTLQIEIQDLNRETARLYAQMLSEKNLAESNSFSAELGTLVEQATHKTATYLAAREAASKNYHQHKATLHSLREELSKPSFGFARTLDVAAVMPNAKGESSQFSALLNALGDIFEKMSRSQILDIHARVTASRTPANTPQAFIPMMDLVAYWLYFKLLNWCMQPEVPHAQLIFSIISTGEPSAAHVKLLHVALDIFALSTFREWLRQDTRSLDAIRFKAITANFFDKPPFLRYLLFSCSFAKINVYFPILSSTLPHIFEATDKIAPFFTDINRVYQYQLNSQHAKNRALISISVYQNGDTPSGSHSETNTSPVGALNTLVKWDTSPSSLGAQPHSLPGLNTGVSYKK